MIKKSLLLCFVGLFILLNARAQSFCWTCSGPSVTIVWEGDGGYRPNCTFSYSITAGNFKLWHNFSSPESWTFGADYGSSFGDIEGSVTNNGYSRWRFETTYNNYYNNSMVAGQIYSRYLDTWNGKNWYFYSKKTSVNEWHYWIGNN